MLSLNDPDSFAAALEQGALVLTPNHQLAVALHETCGVLRRQHALPPVSTSPDIFAVDVWVRQLWNELLLNGSGISAGRQLLEPRHELLLWHNIIQHSRAGDSILNPEATARSASEAFTLMLQYGLPAATLRHWLESEWQLREEFLDISHFLAWHVSFTSLLERQQRLTLAQCVQILTQAITEGELQVPDRLLHFGFSEPPPLYQALLDALAERSKSQSLTLGSHSPHITALSCTSSIQEINSAALWCQQILGGNPDARIGILCPELNASADTLERVFSHHFSRQQFALNYSRTVDQCAVIASALDLLALNREALPTLDICRLLRSPFLPGSDSEQAPRAALTKKLRNEGELMTAPSRLRELCQQSTAAWSCPLLGPALQSFAEAGRRQVNSSMSSGEWLALFSRQLQTLGWPVGSDDEVSEALESWQALLDDFQLCQGFLSAMSCTQALSLLRRLATNTSLPRHQHGAAIRIMTPAEAEHLQFSHLWIMGLSEHAWPPPARSNSLIPWSLQQQYRFPRYDRQQHFEWHQQLLRRLSGAAGVEVRLSYTAVMEGLSSKPAAIVGELTDSMDENQGSQDHQLHPLFSSLQSQQVIDKTQESASLPLQQDERPRGGSSLIQNQAICPFRAFAIHRLGAEELRTPQYGLSPMVTGTILHAALEHIWREIRDYQTLLELPEAQLRSLCESAADEAIRNSARHYPQLMQHRYITLEQQRLQTLLLSWLEEEKKRAFSHVLELEKSVTWQHGALQLRLKFDRVDVLQDQRLAIIDYKSGHKASIRWSDPRPEQPQLLLYLLAAETLYTDQEVSALLFAWINAEQRLFDGRSDSDTDYKGISVEDVGRGQPVIPWEELKQLWRSSITMLADEFIDGLASVSPKNRALHCARCHIRPFCRIDDVPADSEGDDESVLDYRELE